MRRLPSGSFRILSAVFAGDEVDDDEDEDDDATVGAELVLFLFSLYSD